MQISVIPNGIPGPNGRRATELLEGGRPIFGYFGNLNPWKG